MERKVNNFVQNALNLGVIKDDLSLLCLAFAKHDDLVKAKNILANARMTLIEILGEELDDYAKINSDIDVSKNIAEAALIIDSLPNEILPSKDDLIEVLKSCEESFCDSNLKEIILVLKQDKQRFSQQIILLQDICAEEFLK